VFLFTRQFKIRKPQKYANYFVKSSSRVDFGAQPLFALHVMRNWGLNKLGVWATQFEFNLKKFHALVCGCFLKIASLVTLLGVILI